ncbi:MAG TPA: DUF4369 domain-containing protein [Flavobacterium sp.]|nr:DUF4369 domain-containing protein [Flavobacterium sp.]
MKKILLLAGLAVAFVSCQQEKFDGLDLSGEIKGLKQGTLYLKTAKDSQIVILDSMVFKGQSAYHFQVPMEEPTVVYLTLDRGVSASQDNFITVFAEPGEMTVNSTLDQFYADTKVEGSENHQLYAEYLEKKKIYTDRQLDTHRAKVLTPLDNVAKQDSLDKVINKYVRRIHSNAIQFSLSHADKEIAPYIALTEVMPISGQYLDTIYNKLTPQIKESQYGLILKEYLAENE